MKASAPIISIITINYNNSDGLEKTIKSVLDQDFTSIEYIIIDGGSTDGSVDVIKKYENKITYWVSEKDNGIYDAMNKGILMAKGRYLQFLNSGDTLYEKDVIKTEVRYINDCPDIDVFYGDIVMIKNESKLFLLRQAKDVDIAFFINNTINHQAALIKRSLFKGHLYDTNYKMAADYTKFVELALQGKTFYHIDDILVGYDDNGMSMTDHGQKQYKAESAAYWKINVPDGLNKLISDHNIIKGDIGYPLVKLSIRINNFLQLFKTRFTSKTRAVKTNVKFFFKHFNF